MVYQDGLIHQIDLRIISQFFELNVVGVVCILASSSVVAVVAAE